MHSQFVDWAMQSSKAIGWNRCDKLAYTWLVGLLSTFWHTLLVGLNDDDNVGFSLAFFLYDSAMFCVLFSIFVVRAWVCA